MAAPERLFCHVYARGQGNAQMIPGWPYSFAPGVLAQLAVHYLILPSPVIRSFPAPGDLQLTRLPVAGQRRQVGPRATLIVVETPGAATENTGSAPVWRFLITPKWLGWHVLMVVSFWGMLWLGDWQLHRALGGNELSWAYTFEWPLFAGFAVVFWAKTIRDEFRIRTGKVRDPKVAADVPAESGLPIGLGTGQATKSAEDPDETDEELARYNAYLARLNAEVKGHGKWHGFR